MFLNKNILFYNYYKNILIQYWFRKYIFSNKLKLPTIYKVINNITFNNIQDLNNEFFLNFFKIWLLHYNLFLIYPKIKKIKNSFIILNNSVSSKLKKKLYSVDLKIYFFNKFLLYNFFNNLILLNILKIQSKNNLLKIKIFNFKNYSKIIFEYKIEELYNGFLITKNVIDNTLYTHDFYIKKVSNYKNIQRINIIFLKDLYLSLYK